MSPRSEQWHQLVDHLLGRLHRHHHPNRPRRGQLVDELGEARHIGNLAVTGVPDHLVSGLTQARGHVAAHASEANQAQLHDPSRRNVTRTDGSGQEPTRIGMIR